MIPPEEKKRRGESLFKGIINENFSNLETYLNIEDNQAH